jgi:4-diphosphocytidyl-2-C-methyl-D-erythritol kinase
MICFPNAKINLGLNVVEKRTDGYHNIETIFVPIGIKDALEIVHAPELNEPYQWTNTGRVVDVPAEHNICIKALQLIRNQFPELSPVKIHLHKTIPFGAGLGGGSSNGAFMLTLLNDTFNLGLEKEQLIQMASQLGADCAFFIENNPVFATGIGNILNPIELDLSGYFLGLILPEIHVSTQEAYGSLTPKSPKINLSEAIRQPIDTWRDNIVNDFETTVFKKHPELATIKEYLYNQGAVYASMSGSGSSVYGLFKEEPQLEYPGCYIWKGTF